MEELYTRLGHLMELLNVTGKELAKEIGTDTTTISKWKNGQRKLRHRSVYCKKISTYFLSEKFQLQRGAIEKLLELDSYDTKGKEEKDLEEVLQLWLTEESMIQVKKEWNSQKGGTKLSLNLIQTYEKLEGWKKALDEFWEYLDQVKEPVTIYLGDFGDIQWDIVPKECIHSIVKYSLQMIEKGHSVVIIDKIKNEYKPYITLFRWLPLYMSKNVEVLYYQAGEKEFYQQSIYAGENEVVMIGIKGEEEKNAHITMLHKEKASVKFFTDLVKNIAKQSKKLIYHTNVQNTFEMFEIMEKYLKPKQLTYMINRLPSFRNMPLELLDEILEDNQVSGKVKENCLLANQKRRAYRRQFNYRQIYDLDAIEEAVRQEYVIEYDLSRVIGKTIYLTKAQFRKQLEYISQTTSTDSYVMVLTSFQNLNLNVEDTSMIVQDDSVAIAWNSKHYETRIHSTELTLVGGYFQYLKKLWNEIPLISKNDQWTQKQFERILSKNKSKEEKEEVVYIANREL